MSATTEVAVPKNGNGGHSVPATHSEAPSDFLIRLASDTNVDAQKLEVISRVYRETMEQQRQWVREDAAERARVAYVAAKSAMQAELPVVDKDTPNPHTKSKYADFGALWEACRPVWTKYGFSVSFQSVLVEGLLPDGTRGALVRVSLLLEHTEPGASVAHTAEYSAPDAPPDTVGMRGTANKTVPQGNQATTTFLQRGLLCRALGIAMKGEDNDGNDGARDTGYRPHTSETPSRQVPPPPTPPMRPSKAWVKEVAAKLSAMLAKDLEKWKAMVEQAFQRAPTTEDLEELERIIRPDIEHKDTPQVYRVDMQGAFLAARKRLAQPFKFEALLLDAYGEELDGEVYADPIKFAEAICELHDATFPADRAALLEFNADAIAAAREYPGAAKLLSALEQTEPESGGTDSTSDSPKPPLVHAPVEPPMNNGKKVWSVWINLFRDELATTPPDELEEWGKAQEPVLSTAGKEGAAQRAMARKALVAALANRPDNPAGTVGTERPDKDQRWVDDVRTALGRMPNTLAGRLAFDGLMSSELTKTMMGRLQMERADLFAQVKEAFLAKNRELPMENPR